MIANPSVVVDELIHRITSIVLRTYEVEQLLPATASNAFHWPDTNLSAPSPQTPGVSIFRARYSSKPMNSAVRFW